LEIIFGPLKRAQRLPNHAACVADFYKAKMRRTGILAWINDSVKNVAAIYLDELREPGPRTAVFVIDGFASHNIVVAVGFSYNRVGVVEFACVGVVRGVFTKAKYPQSLVDITAVPLRPGRERCHAKP
jgi:hypothetical protein